MSPDPSESYFADPTNPQSFNLYAYTRNNPLTSIDPDGLRCVWDDGSFDSDHDPETGSKEQCENAQNGGTWYEPGTYSPCVDWASTNQDGTLTLHMDPASANVLDSGRTSSDQRAAPPWPMAAVDLVTSSADGWLNHTLDVMTYSPRNQTTRPYQQLFSSNYCGKGGGGASGPSSGLINSRCAIHDAYFDDPHISAASNYPGGPPMTSAQKSGAKACNQALFNAARTNERQPGTTALEWWLTHGSHPPFGASLIGPGTEAKPW